MARQPDIATQASLLGLPREIRDLIYLNLIPQRTCPPENPNNAGDREPDASSPCTTFFEVVSPKPAMLQLKLCNRQLYEEVHHISRKHLWFHNGAAHLDIMVKGSSIWPTWILLPVTPYLDPVVDVTLRIFEATGWGSEFSTRAYRALWTLFRLLVFHGSCLNHNTRGLATPLDITRLRFDVRLCFPTSVDDLFGTYRDVFGKIEKLAFDNVGLGHIASIEACLGDDKRVWRLKQLPTGLTWASRV
ncbi:hypothetical protein BAUCODRAFT_130743 [Baudoinia panamericana UAMH 10762]|uniref:F-box domain-containing protein n=1 Tax=Baudoinia panamericana (strain UAMH 10762) TaxID=717646 RepID=M2NEH6_BAUPA|nr:uncharacterized protein BAUCODRAFT_130743 [Baudoinia panamericana UAMH 10762]EMC97644.1 hypothetical protein BAUCODRAFT_130743 [Baudoinia panamericana UAMH 10762]